MQLMPIENNQVRVTVRQCSLVVERLLRKQKVAGSIPVVGFFFVVTNYKKYYSKIKASVRRGLIAQLVRAYG